MVKLIFFISLYNESREFKKNKILSFKNFLLYFLGAEHPTPWHQDQVKHKFTILDKNISNENINLKQLMYFWACNSNEVFFSQIFTNSQK